MVKKRQEEKKQSLRIDSEIQVVEKNEVYFWRGEREREKREQREEREERERKEKEDEKRGRRERG